MFQETVSALRHPGPALSVSCLRDIERENKSWEEGKLSRCVEHSQHHAWAPLQEHQPGVKIELWKALQEINKSKYPALQLVIKALVLSHA